VPSSEQVDLLMM